MKKLVALFLGLALTATVFAGGRQGGSSSGSTGRRGLLANGDVTLTIFNGHGFVGSSTSFAYEDNSFTRKVADETGINIVMDSVSSVDVQTRISTMLNTGDYPDIILYNYFTPADLAFYGSQGIFMPVNNYDLSKYPNIAKILAEAPQVIPKNTSPDGNMYVIPGYNDCIHCVYDQGTINFYMPFMRDNGIKKPTTYAEFIDYLRWVKANDANGNGSRNDEIPLLWTSGELWQAIGFFARNYMPYIPGDFANINGRATLQYTLPEFRETLRLMNSLYREGLIAEDVFTMTGDDKSYIVNAEVPIMAASIGRNNGANRSSVAGTKRWVQYMVLPPLVGETGQAYAGYAPDYGYTSWVITDKCKNPEAAIALYNYILDPLLLNQGEYGEKGLNWDDPDPGTQSFLGTTPLFKLITSVDQAQNAINNKWYYGANPGYIREYRYGQQADDIATVRRFYETWDASLLDQVANNPTYYTEYYWIGFEAHQTKNPSASLYIPPLVMNDTDSNRVIDINATLNTYRDQSAMEFITGIRNINNNADWNAYLSQLNQLGAAELTALQQKYIR